MRFTVLACSSDLSLEIFGSSQSSFRLRMKSRVWHVQMSIMEEVSHLNWGAFKPKVADAIVAHLEPIQAKYNEVMADPAILDKVNASPICHTP